jgi:hypothetical protein
MNASTAYDTITAAKFTLLVRVMDGSYHDPAAPNADLQMAARLSAITDAQTAPLRRARCKAGRLAQDIGIPHLRSVLSRRNGDTDPVGEFTGQEVQRVVLAINTIADLAS